MCRPIILAAVSLLAVGCSGRATVTGRVTYPDGSPVESGNVVAEGTVNGKLVLVQGAISPDGSFRLGGDRPGDGVLPGRYKVAVHPVSLGDHELSAGKQPAVDGKYTRYDSSGFTLEVPPGGTELNLKVTRPTPRGKQN
ncbi:carboxypeptidase regulatory-like domain-containing protein [bacterium]|nr:carboxypeptidase regulatory-like domain-containing protein [bacterium]